MLAEKKIAGSYRPLKVRFPDVVDVHPAAFDVFSRLAFGRTQTAVHQKLDQRLAGAVELAFSALLNGSVFSARA